MRVPNSSCLPFRSGFFLLPGGRSILSLHTSVFGLFTQYVVSPETFYEVLPVRSTFVPSEVTQTISPTLDTGTFLVIVKVVSSPFPSDWFTEI